MNLLLSVAGFLVILFPIVIIHELGHFLFARMNGISVLKFSVGFGGDKWAIFSWVDKYGTKWQITPLLFGGFVTMKGQYDNPEDQFEYNEKYKNLPENEKKDSFLFKNRAQKIAVAFAGPLFNIILTVTILFFLAAFYGQAIKPNIIGGFSENSVAKNAGLMVGDRIVKIDDKSINDFSDIVNVLSLSTGKKMLVVVKRSDKTATNKIKSEKMLFFKFAPMKIGNDYKLGIYSNLSSNSFKKITVIESVSYAFNNTFKLSKQFLSNLGQMISGERSSSEIGGIISIAGISGQALSYGFYSVMYLMAYLSIIIGIMNLMPIPVLDGGQIFIYTLESIIRRDIPNKIKAIIFSLGWFFILALMLLATYNDVKRVIVSNINLTSNVNEQHNKK